MCSSTLDWRKSFTAEQSGLREEGEGLQSQKNCSDRSRKINWLWNCSFCAFSFSQRPCFLTVIGTWEIPTSLSAVWCWTFNQELIFYFWKAILRKNMKLLCLTMEPFDKKGASSYQKSLFFFFSRLNLLFCYRKQRVCLSSYKNSTYFNRKRVTFSFFTILYNLARCLSWKTGKYLYILHTADG